MPDEVVQIVTEEAAEVQAEAVEVAADAAVEVEQIRADTAIELAEISAELEGARLDAAAGVASETIEQRLEQCQQNIETMRTETAEQVSALVETMATELASIRQLLEERTQPPPPPPPSEGDALPEADVQAPPAPKAEKKSRPIRVV